MAHTKLSYESFKKHQDKHDSFFSRIVVCNSRRDYCGKLGHQHIFSIDSSFGNDSVVGQKTDLAKLKNILKNYFLVDSSAFVRTTLISFKNSKYCLEGALT